MKGEMILCRCGFHKWVEYVDTGVVLTCYSPDGDEWREELEPHQARSLAHDLLNKAEEADALRKRALS